MMYTCMYALNLKISKSVFIFFQGKHLHPVMVRINIWLLIFYFCYNNHVVNIDKVLYLFGKKFKEEIV